MGTYTRNILIAGLILGVCFFIYYVKLSWDGSDAVEYGALSSEKLERNLSTIRKYGFMVFLGCWAILSGIVSVFTFAFSKRS